MKKVNVNMFLGKRIRLNSFKAVAFGLASLFSNFCSSQQVDLPKPLTYNVLSQSDFLDIELNNISGFQFLDYLSYIDFHLIFTTAFDEYAIEALRVKAFDYLMKPVSGAHLRTCIDRLISEMNEKDVDTIGQTNIESVNKLALPVGSSSMFVDPVGILKVQADGNFSVLTMSTGQEYYISKSLKEMERLLQAPPFIRVQISHC